MWWLNVSIVGGLNAKYRNPFWCKSKLSSNFENPSEIFFGNWFARQRTEVRGNISNMSKRGLRENQLIQNVFLARSNSFVSQTTEWFLFYSVQWTLSNLTKHINDVFTQWHSNEIIAHEIDIIELSYICKFAEINRNSRTTRPSSRVRDILCHPPRKIENKFEFTLINYHFQFIYLLILNYWITSCISSLAVAAAYPATYYYDDKLSTPIWKCCSISFFPIELRSKSSRYAHSN